MTKADIIRIVEDRIKAIEASEFQDFCDRLLLKLYDDYTQVRAAGRNGDMKNDGYCFFSRKFFQAHASRGEAISKIKTKIETDLNGCLQKQTNVQEFIYITNDVQVGEVESFIDGLRSQNPNLTIETWSPLKIANKISDFPISVIEQIISRNLTSTTNNTLNQQNNYITLALSEEEDLGILAEIFQFIASSIGTNAMLDTTILNKQEKLKKLLTKIKINFNKVQQSTIQETFTNLWTRTQLVGKYIESQLALPEGEDLILALKEDIQSKFMELLNVQTTNVAVKDVQVFSEIAKKYIPNGKERNPHYQANAKAIVLYFFELCDIGKKTEDDINNGMQQSLFNDIDSQ